MSISSRLQLFYRSYKCLFLNPGLKISRLFGIVYLPGIRFAARNLICVMNNPVRYRISLCSAFRPVMPF